MTVNLPLERQGTLWSRYLLTAEKQWTPDFLSRLQGGMCLSDQFSACLFEAQLFQLPVFILRMLFCQVLSVGSPITLGGFCKPQGGPTSHILTCHAQLPSPQATSANLKSPFSASGIVSQQHLLFLFLTFLLTLLYSSGSFLLHVVQEERNPGKAGGKEGLLLALVPHPWARGAGITES